MPADVKTKEEKQFLEEFILPKRNRTKYSWYIEVYYALSLFSQSPGPEFYPRVSSNNKELMIAALRDHRTVSHA